MPAIDQLLARARLHPQPNVPDDTVPYEDTPYPTDLPPASPRPSTTELPDQAAADHLRALCETAIATLTPNTLDFLTDQIPDLHSAWLLGCALHVAGIEDGARFWWQYAAGDGHALACYSLFLYHQARAEQHAADFYRCQTQLETTIHTDTLTVAGTCPPQEIRFDASLPTLLRTLSRLATAPGATPRRRRHRIIALTNYVAETVTRHYRRHPNVELPIPEPRFADRVEWLLTATLPWPRHTRPSRTPGPALPARRTARPPHDPAAAATRK
ncbi:hypothetical protein [Streptomyces sp. Ru71]|uniref:hypothetical protein n=1 Tax=Streptomyces sp. Ru71 TaxID=2080746 RepID=UPI0021562BAB|nr:hypothetical protein [Streptomyces sp. Ru71]